MFSLVFVVGGTPVDFLTIERATIFVGVKNEAKIIWTSEPYVWIEI